MTRFLAACAILAPISVAYRYQRQKLAIAWRKWLTGRVLDLYFSNKVYYALERQSGGGITSPDYDETVVSAGQSNKEVDNPDQRISEDIRSFTEFSLTFFLTLVTSFIDLVCFSFILFSIMPQLFIAIFGFATLGTFLTICVGRVLIRLNYESLAKEADFRFSLVRVRENAESIAFYAGEAVEERETFRRFRHVIGNMTQINFAQMKLDFVTTFYNYITWILPIMVVAPEYFAGNVELGVISQASAAFGHILDDLSIVINSFTDVSKFSAGIDRLYSFICAIQVLDPERDIGSLLLSTPPADATLLSAYTPSRSMESVAAETIRVKVFDPTFVNVYSGAQPGSSSSSILSIQDLKLITPDRNRVLVEDLNFSLPQGKNLLIVGASGAGKSSLLRAVAGLWSSGAGEIVRPSSEHIYFLPQRPYCPPGSLRDQLLYPSTEMNFNSNQIGIDASAHSPDGGPSPKDRRRLERDWSDEELLGVLDSVNLPDLASRSGGLNAVLDWSNTLSLGEQQRLAFGRLVVNRPRLVVMDESTSALDVLAEKKMYNLLKDLATEMKGNGGLTYVSVGHRPTLLAHHDLKLSLRDGTGVSSDIPPNAGAIDEGFVLA
jgi:putative ATP-binding cassette transporter